MVTQTERERERAHGHPETSLGRRNILRIYLRERSFGDLCYMGRNYFFQ